MGRFDGLGVRRGAVAEKLELLRPVVCRQAALGFESGEELARVRQHFPDLRKKGRATRACDNDQSVCARRQPVQQIPFIGDWKQLQRRQYRDLQPDDVEFGFRNRVEARIAERRLERGEGHVCRQRMLGFERAATATQLTIDFQGRERRPRFRQYATELASRNR